MRTKTGDRSIEIPKFVGIVASLAAVAGCCMVTAIFIIFGIQLLPHLLGQSPTPMKLSLATLTPTSTALILSAPTTIPTMATELIPSPATPIPEEIILSPVAPTPTELALPSLTPTPAESISSTATPLINRRPFVVSGTISNRKQIEIPSNTRVLLLWAVMITDPDSAYVFGEGEINLENNTFEIILDKTPPAEALNLIDGNGFGVAYAVLTTDRHISKGAMQNSDLEVTNFFGWSGQHAVLYVEGNLSDLEFNESHWIQKFPPGYSVGKGIKIPDTHFDGYKPISPTDVEIIIDDHIEFVNWS